MAHCFAQSWPRPRKQLAQKRKTILVTVTTVPKSTGLGFSLDWDRGQEVSSRYVSR